METRRRARLVARRLRQETAGLPFRDDTREFSRSRILKRLGQ